MMDDDAILYDEHHNSGSEIFAEMAANGPDAYRGLDVFFPIFPRKHGFNAEWAKDRDLFENNHVFRRNLDLKGSMFIVRNFLKKGRTPVLPRSDFLLHGEDTLFAVEAVAKGCTVMECWNIVLKELTARSHFERGGGRKEAMREGNAKIAELYQEQGLSLAPGKHLLETREFKRRSWGGKPTRIVVPKRATSAAAQS